MRSRGSRSRWNCAYKSETRCEAKLMETRPLISVVDDDESVRESLPDLLKEFGFAAQAFSSAEEFLVSRYLKETKCLILDVAMPGLSEPDLQRELARRRQEIPIVFITAHLDEKVRPRLLEQGAVEFLTKPLAEEALLGAIRHAIERSQTALGNEAEMQALRGRYASLTPREREVLALVISGLLNKQVGFELKWTLVVRRRS